MECPEYLPAHLTEQQIAAIVQRGSPLLIILGPGSGKTEVMTWRVAHLIRQHQVEPAHCLTTTFMNKAASLQTQTQARFAVDALLPSVLDRTFKGEL